LTAANVITGALVLSIFLIVFSLGLKASLDDALFLFRRPMLLARAVAAIYVVVPAFAIALSLIFPLSPPAIFALIALAISPIPPVLPLKEMKVGADRQYAVGLLVAAAFVALVMTPLLLEIAAHILKAEAHIAPGRIARTLLVSIALPLTTGMALRGIAPKLAETVHRYTSKGGMALLLGGFVLVLMSEWRVIVGLIGDGTVFAIIAVVIVGLAAGHLLGSGSEGHRAALALAAATRHPGVAIAIAAVNFPDQQRVLTAAVLLFLITNLIVTIPYIQWIKARTRVRARATG